MCKEHYAINPPRPSAGVVVGKTTKEWFDTLPSPYREQALMNTPYGRWYDRVSSLSRALYKGFTWDRSPEGGDYWHPLAERARAGEFDVAPPAPPEPEKPPVDPPAGHHWVCRGERFTGPAGPIYIRYLGYQWSACFGPDEAALGLGGIYWEAVKDPDPVCNLPVPEGYSHWEYRGRNWHADGVVYAYLSTFGALSRNLKPQDTLGSDGHYWEAIPLPPKPIVVGYRLLNQGEVIREGDEVWSGASNAWKSTSESNSLRPDGSRDTMLRRRPIVSYEDSAPSA